jgi:hypothetical protein
MWVYNMVWGRLSDASAELVFLVGMILAGVLIVWDPIGRFLGPPVERPIQTKSAICFGIAAILAAAIVAGERWIPGRGDGKAVFLTSLALAGILYFIGGVLTLVNWLRSVWPYLKKV